MPRLRAEDARERRRGRSPRARARSRPRSAPSTPDAGRARRRARRSSSRRATRRDAARRSRRTASSTGRASSSRTATSASIASSLISGSGSCWLNFARSKSAVRRRIGLACSCRGSRAPARRTRTAPPRDDAAGRRGRARAPSARMRRRSRGGGPGRCGDRRSTRRSRATPLACVRGATGAGSASSAAARNEHDRGTGDQHDEEAELVPAQPRIAGVPGAVAPGSWLCLRCCCFASGLLELAQPFMKPV